ncbi:MAG TPA: 4-hydroxy-tetrahydrodipicolinate synthase [Ignavibacteriaceae bacterium]|nr:4-hydroxy-tetrahydrodipicolinate synthase [Ignavibacteriaceae bacterium]
MFKGAGTAIITPFDQDHNVDYNALKKITKHQVDNGIDAIIILGTTGEAPVIEPDERKKIIETIMTEAAGKCKIIVGTGGNYTKKVVELNKSAEEFKPDGLLVANPYYNKGTQESLVEHYKYLSESTSTPIMLYNVPSRTGMNLLPETAVKIHEECKNVVAIKEASGSISQIAHLCSIKPDSLRVLSGNDDQTLPIMAVGGDGVISVFTNAFPKQMKDLTDAFFAGNISLAQNLNNSFLEMMNALFLETSPGPLKYILKKMGFCENIFRLPIAPVTEKTEAKLDEVYGRFSKLI